VTGRSEVVHVRGGGLNLAGSLINTGSVLALFWVLDHHLGQTLTGVYIQAFALRRILQTIALGGMRSAMTRFVAIDLADDDDASLRGTIAVGIAVSVGLAAILGIILFLAAPWVATSVYGDPELVAGLRWVAVGLPSAAFTIVVLSATTGWRTMRPNAIVGSMFEPILQVVLTAMALALGASPAR
jgi:O-antigen/teichoic acid export membrane protein